MTLRIYEKQLSVEIFEKEVKELVFLYYSQISIDLSSICRLSLIRERKPLVFINRV